MLYILEFELVTGRGGGMDPAMVPDGFSLPYLSTRRKPTRVDYIIQ